MPGMEAGMHALLTAISLATGNLAFYIKIKFTDSKTMRSTHTHSSCSLRVTHLPLALSPIMQLRQYPHIHFPGLSLFWTWFPVSGETRNQAFWWKVKNSVFEWQLKCRDIKAISRVLQGREVKRIFHSGGLKIRLCPFKRLPNSPIFPPRSHARDP